MQKNLSKELFERISNLSDTLKLETIQLVNEASAPKNLEYEDSQSDNSVYIIESSQDVENNLFIKFLRENQNYLKEMKTEIEASCEKNAHKVPLEDLMNIAVSLHVKIEDSIDLLCNKLGMKPEEIQGFKSPLEESVPVSLFQSNAKEKAFNKNNNTNNSFVNVETVTKNKLKEKMLNEINNNVNNNTSIDNTKEHENTEKDGKEQKDQSLLGKENNNQNNNSTSTENPNNNTQEPTKDIKKLNLEVYEIPGKSQGFKDIHLTDLKNLGLSEETRKLLGLE